MTFAAAIILFSTSAVVIAVVSSEMRFCGYYPVVFESSSLIIRYEWTLQRQVVLLSTDIRTQQKGALSIVDNESMLVISEDIPSAGVVHASTAITSVFEEFLGTRDGPEIVPDFM